MRIISFFLCLQLFVISLCSVPCLSIPAPPSVSILDFIAPDVLQRLIRLLAKLADTNKDGVLSSKELQHWFETISQESAKRMNEREFSNIDQNSDGSVSLSEFSDYREQAYIAVPKIESVTNTLFEKLDKNHDQSLSKKELNTFFVDEQRTDKEIWTKAVLSMRKYGKNGTMDKNQFSKFLSATRKLDLEFLSWMGSLQEIFVEADKSKDGKLDEEELAVLFYKDISHLYPPVNGNIKQRVNEMQKRMQNVFSKLGDQGLSIEDDVVPNYREFAKSSFTYSGDLLIDQDELKWIVSIFDPEEIKELETLIEA